MPAHDGFYSVTDDGDDENARPPSDGTTSSWKIPESCRTRLSELSSLPPTMAYQSSFLSPAEEAHIVSSLPSSKWTSLSHRRLQCHPSALTKTGTLLSAPLPAYLSSPIVSRFADQGIFSGSPHGAPNHCLVNEYGPGQGIMPHEDGPSYFCCTATVSLGSTIVLDVRAKDDPRPASTAASTSTPISASDPAAAAQKRWRIVQEPRSLLVTSGMAYETTLHGIAEVEVDADLGPETVANWNVLRDDTRANILRDGGRNTRSKRTSLTYRDVIKVSQLGNRILGVARAR